MAHPDHLALIEHGVNAWNDWMFQNPRVLRSASADLSGANLDGANLLGANLAGVDLHGTSLADANLQRTDLQDANLIGANIRRGRLAGALLVGSHLARTNLTGADLTGSDLRNADLVEANLSAARLVGADLSRALLSETVFGGTQISECHGLGSCIHQRPSTLDFRTLHRSSPLPLQFLRGCGLPEHVIQYLPSLLNQAIQFSSCFISYSAKDQSFAERLYADLQDKGVRCWFAPHNIQAGKKLQEQIDEAIRLYDRLLLILSEHSMNSEWVKTEIATARQKEIDQDRRVLFPISLVSFATVRRWSCFDADTGKDSAREIREYFVPDFSEWKDHDSYVSALGHLVKDLKADEARGESR